MTTSEEKEILGLRSIASDEIAKKLQSIHDRDYYSVLGDFFEASAISVKNAVDLNDREVYEKRFADIAKSYGENGMKIFAECLSLFTDEIHAAIHGNAMFRDFAGELYMASGTNSKGLGQFFTPYHISHLMAECNLEKDRFLDEIEKNPDRVPRCFHMSYLTLSLLGAPAVVRLGDALSMKYHRAWFTPAYIFNWPHFKKELNGGKQDSYPTTPTKHADTDNKVEKETKENLSAITEPTMDANGQYSLF